MEAGDQERTSASAWGGKGGRVGPAGAKDGKRGTLPEEAVLKIVANLDASVASAEAMELTGVGFIDCLRKVNRDKFQTLKQVKEHFMTKVDKVVLAKEY